MGSSSARWLAGCAALVVLSGCYASHGLDRDPTRRDAGPRGLDASLPDASRPDAARPDAGRVDGGHDAGNATCRPVSMTTACVIGPDRPSLSTRHENILHLRTDDCHCGGTLHCRAEVQDNAIRLTTAICDEEDCRACTEPSEITCSFGPVDTDLYTVYVNDEARFQFYAMPGDRRITRCQEAGSSGGGLCEWPGGSLDWYARWLCYRPVSDTDLVEFEIVDPDASCILEPGTCDVHVDEVTREIGVYPLVRTCDEGTSTWGCTGMSGELRRFCRAVGPFPAGDYVVRMSNGPVQGRGRIQLTEGAPGDGDPVCIPLR